ncbi:CAP domain-containing protein [Aquimarina sediminis]|uniref:CAP domain-containing protein n=1 Tax=Aquimarina sediminis TaxID=2070536 RepID=UPI000CA03481|nr:CAP domain-containing protein [Aquimarina sediminis]
MKKIILILFAWVSLAYSYSPKINTLERFSNTGGENNVSEIINNSNILNPLSVNCSEVIVDIVFDRYRSETSWKIENGSGQIMLSGRGTSNSPSSVSQNVCLENGNYTFVIDDTYGDGICCRYGEGSYTVSLNGTVLASGGSFRYSESKVFTIGQALPPPNPFNLTASDIKANSMRLSWEAQGEITNQTTFDIYNNNEIIKSIEGIETTTSLTGLVPETSYNLSVRAKNIQGDLSEFSNSITVSTLADNNGGGVSQEMQELLSLVNQAREAEGVHPLTINTKLTAAAEFHANDMNNNGFFSHTGSNGSSVSDRVNDQGYSWRRVAENIAKGQRNPQEVHDAWMNSSGHRRNILNSGYTEIGLARVASYWVQVFAAPSGAASSRSNAIVMEQFEPKQFDMYPNLLQGDQNKITVVGHDGNTAYQVYSLTGMIMSQGKVENGTVELNDLSSGIYLVKFVMNQKVITKRLVKK